MTVSVPLLAAHASTAMVCLLLGAYQLLRRVKGDRPHRITGWIWVAGMLFVATSSFAIRDLRDGQFSLLHALSLVTLVSLVIGVIAARRGRITPHRASMRGSWIGLSGAFIGAVAVPDRAIPTFTVSNPLGALAALAAVAAITAVVITLAHLAWRPHRPNGTTRTDGAGTRPWWLHTP